jgi:hypothetical protein
MINNSKSTVVLCLSALLLMILTSGLFSHVYCADNMFLANSGFEGFDLESPVSVYNRSNIFKHINGEAEVYLPLGFQFLYLQSHRKRDSGAVISVEAYDMGSKKGAAAVFERYSHDGGSRLKGFSGQAWSDESRVLFYSDKYFIQVMSDPEAELDEEPKPEEMIELARQVDKALGK